MKPTRSRSSVLLLVAAAGALGAWPGARGPDPVALLVWLALVAFPAGWLSGALGARLLPLGWLVPASWWALAAAVGASSALEPPSLAWAALVWSGGFAAGLALGTLGRSRPWSGAGLALLACGTLAALPAPSPSPNAWGERAQWPAPLARVLLDLSPATLVCESAGIDWMRHPAVYDRVGTDRFHRAPWRGSLAGPVALVVGCALSAGASLRGRSLRRARPRSDSDEGADEEVGPWRCASTSAPSRST